MKRLDVLLKSTVKVMWALYSEQYQEEFLVPFFNVFADSLPAEVTLIIRHAEGDVTVLHRCKPVVYDEEKKLFDFEHSTHGRITVYQDTVTITLYDAQTWFVDELPLNSEVRPKWEGTV